MYTPTLASQKPVFVSPFTSVTALNSSSTTGLIGRIKLTQKAESAVKQVMKQFKFIHKGDEGQTGL